MTFKKGQSGNPNGRPKKDRAIASQIERALNRTELGPDGKRHKRILLLGEIYAKALTTGKVELPNGQTLLLPPREWMEMSKFVVTHVDGPLKTAIETGALPLRVLIGYANDDDDHGDVAPLTRGPADDQAGA
jgi:Family of unknown function (DUF5681)